MPETSYIGAGIPNIDAYDKVVGGRGYPVNVSLPGMLHGKLLRSYYPHANIISIDTSEAEKLPGVKSILTADDVPQKKFNPIYFMPVMALGANHDMDILNRTVRYSGQPIAAVAATSPEIAEQALELIEVEVEELPAVFTTDDAQAEGAVRLHDYTENNVAKHPYFETGDVDTALAEADRVFEHTYQTQRVHTCYLEPRMVVVDADTQGNLTVYSSNQHLFGLREKLAFVLDLPVSKVRVIKPPYIGGGFGGKLDIGYIEPLAAIMSRRTGRPVKFVHTRAEDFITGARNPVNLKLTTAVKNDGAITARCGKSTFDAGAYATHGSTVIMVHGLFGFMYTYNCPNRRWEGVSVHTNNMISGGYRGYGAPQAAFAVESQLDEICAETGLDPLEIRIKNGHREGEQHPVFNQTFTTYRFEECIRQGAGRIGWERRTPPNSDPGARQRGLGMACVPTWTSNCTGQPDLYEHSGALVKLNPDGSADIATACIDIGSGQNTVFSQMVAEELGIPLEQVRMSSVDTGNVPFDAPTHASRGTYAAGGAVKAAAADAKSKLFAVAATMLEANPGDLEARAGKIYVKGSETSSVTVQEVAARADSPLVQVTAQGPQTDSTPFRGTIIGVSSLNPKITPIPCGAMFVEVVVDTDTGEVKVEHVVYAHDIGRVINPVTAEGQVEGAVQQGIGYALMEHMQFDPASGACLSADFLDYKMPTAVEMPDKIETIFIESMEQTGPFGAKSLAECCLIVPAPAIANAVYNAVGVRVRELPITPEKVLTGLGKL